MHSSPILFSVQLIFWTWASKKYHFRKNKTALLKEKWFVLSNLFTLYMKTGKLEPFTYNTIPKTSDHNLKLLSNKMRII